MADMCPHCGAIVALEHSLTVAHALPTDESQICPGSQQIPRCAESDRRRLWNGEPNPHQPSITCPVCGRTSYNPNDIKHGYCGACHDFTSGVQFAHGLEPLSDYEHQ